MTEEEYFNMQGKVISLESIVAIDKRQKDDLMKKLKEAIEKAKKWKEEAEKWEFAFDKVTNKFINSNKK